MNRQGNYYKTKLGIPYVGQTNDIVKRYPGAERTTVLYVIEEKDAVKRNRLEFFMIAEMIETETETERCANIARTKRLRG